MFRLIGTATLSGVIAGGILLAASSMPAVGASTALAPSSQIVRSTMLEELVDLPGGTYNMVIAELTVDPGGETPVHIHPGPSAGFVAEGRLTFSLAGQSSTSSYSAGSAIQHPWDKPHVMSNRSDTQARMYSFEITPVN